MTKKMADGIETADFHENKTGDVEELLRTDLNLGLKEAEVESRRKEYGFNEVSEKKINPVVRFSRKFWGLTAWILRILSNN